MKIKKYNRSSDVVVRDADKTVYKEDNYVVIRTVYEDEGDYIYNLYQNEEEWREVDNLVTQYQRQFEESPTEDDLFYADQAGAELIEKFRPLFKKYVALLKSGQINFHNTEQKQFVRLFMPEYPLVLACCRKYPARIFRDQITQRFNFIIEGYGHQSEEEIMDDMQVCFFILAKRYKYVDRSFCCYVYNCFRYEVFRVIQKFQNDPTNMHYNTTEYEEGEQMTLDDYSKVEEPQYEDEQGLPDATWLKGETCSDIFKNLTPTERLILSKYYLQEWNDGQIAELLGMHINTANQQRLAITKKVCRKMGFSPKDIVRHRNSGRKAVTPSEVA